MKALQLSVLYFEWHWGFLSVGGRQSTGRTSVWHRAGTGYQEHLGKGYWVRRNGLALWNPGGSQKLSVRRSLVVPGRLVMCWSWLNRDWGESTRRGISKWGGDTRRSSAAEPGVQYGLLQYCFTSDAGSRHGTIASIRNGAVLKEVQTYFGRVLADRLFIRSTEW